MAPRDFEFIATKAPPYALRVMTVTRGTTASANAWSNFAPRRTAPSHSWPMPGKKPVTSAITTSGIPNASQVRTKRAAFSPAAESRTPPITCGLFAITPTVRPPRRPITVVMFSAHISRSSNFSPSLSRIASTSGCTS